MKRFSLKKKEIIIKKGGKHDTFNFEITLQHTMNIALLNLCIFLYQDEILLI